MKILIVAGGTGGHLYPGIAVARALSGHEVEFVVRRGDIGKEILAEEGFPVHEIAGQGLPRALSTRWMSFPFAFLRGWMEAKALLQDVHPDRVLGMGGYLSVPVIMRAHGLRIPTVLHEQNVYPGLANRFLSRWVDSVAVSFPDSQRYFRPGKSWVSGLPIRSDIGTVEKAAARAELGLAPDLPGFLVFGGSLGALRINSVIVETWKILLNQGFAFQVIHVTGTQDYPRIRELYKGLSLRAQVMPYCHAMASAYAASDAVVSRAGASTIAELIVARRPVLLVPYPFASDNHQMYNARLIEQCGLGQVVSDADLTPSVAAEFLARVGRDDAFKGRFDSDVRSLIPNSSTHGAAKMLAEYLTT